ncbi:MAG: hypothetical protein J6T51_02110 [Kiritimatiellae bacterium]|nr:hypothetical protein [Kiritimatiellia bacterium]
MVKSLKTGSDALRRVRIGMFAAVAALAASVHAEIPARYIPLDWLDTAGAQWILTDYVPKCTDRFEMSVRLKSLDGTQCFYCSRSTSATSLTMTAFLFAGNSWRFDRKSNGTAMSEPAPEIDVDYVIVDDFATRECTINGTPVYTNSNAEAFTPGSPLALFASHEVGMSLSPTTTMGNYARYRFYSFRVYNVNGNLVREYLPVIDTQATDARSACGVYETQNGTYFPNVGAQPVPSIGRSGTSITLESDEEWDALGGARYLTTIDLNGHNLRLHALDMPAVITNSSETVGELHLDFAGDVENSLVDIFGNVKVVKEGAGAYSSTRDYQTFSGGFDIRAGKVVATASGNTHRLGAAGSEIRVGAGATIDMNGTIDHHEYLFVLDGGTLTNSVTVASAWSKAMISSLRLGADSAISLGSSLYGFINSGYAAFSLDLGGHALKIDTGTTFYFANVTSTAGTIVLDSNVEFYRQPSDLRASDVIVNGQLHVNPNAGTVLFGNCVFNTPVADSSTSFTGPIHVYGALRPNTDYFHGCEMQDGSTLDLRGRTAPFLTKGRNVGSTDVLTTITFATNATVTVDVRGRALTEGTCLVRWDEKPDDTTSFAFDAETALLGIAPFVTDEGLYYGASATYPDKAVWTGAANDGVLTNPVNWSCVNAAGEVIANALPAAMSDVVLTNAFAFNVPSGSSLPCARLVFDGASLSADCDWRGLGKVNVSGSLDLDGHTLRVAGLAGDGTITSSFDLTVPELERASAGSTLYRNTVAGNLFTNNFDWAQDAVHRVICQNSALPCIIDYDFGDPTLVTAYKIHVGPHPDASEQHKRSPCDWQFFGSDDKDSWTLLDERTNEVDWVGWECRTFTFANTTAYRYYRISISKAGPASDGYMELTQLEYGLAEKGFGTLQIDVPAGEVSENDSVSIDGNVRVEKTGGGLFVASKAHQGYNMGTIISAGSVRCGTADAAIGRGKVTVCADTTLDFGSAVNAKSGVYRMDLAGTVIATNAATQRVFGSITLSGDAKIVGRDESFAFYNISVSPSLLALNGHTLTIEANGYVYLGAWHDDGTGGRLLLTGPEGTRFGTTDGYGLSSCTIEFASGVVMKGSKNFVTGDFIYDAAAWQLNTSAFTLGVHGKFVPGAIYPALTMCDGSTLDLSQKSGTWNADGIAAVAGSGDPRTFTEPGLVSFASGATVTIDLHGRTFALGEKIISWVSRPEGTTFVFDTATAAGVSPVAGETGLFYGTNGAVERAVWTGAANDGVITNPVNWTCTDIAGVAVQDGLPGAGSIVRIEGSVAMQIPASAPLACERLEFGDCTLTADCDWRGLSFSTCSGGTIDLRGHKLYVTGLGGDVTVTDTTEYYELLEAIDVTEGVWVNTDYTPDCTDRVHIKVKFANTSGNKCLYCSRTMSGNNYQRTFTCFAISNKFRFDRNTTNTSASPAINTSNDYMLTADGNTLVATVNNGNSVTMASGTFTPGSPFVLFASHGARPGASTGAYFVGRFYYFRVFNSAGNLVREYLPARRSTDGAVGILETTQHTFLQSSGTAGEMTAAGNVLCMKGTNPGELHVTVPAGVTNENYATTLTGNLKLFKEGEGTLVGGKSGQRYGGGTVIACGTARPRTGVQNAITYYESQAYWGGEFSPLIVERGAVFDIAGQFAYRLHPIVLNGGTLANFGPDQTSEQFGGIGNVTLMDDSTLDLQASTAFNGGDYIVSPTLYANGTRIELGGHTLTVRIGRDKTLRLGELALNGTMDVMEGGCVRTYWITSFPMSTLDLRLSGDATLWQDIDNFTVRSFAMAETTAESVGLFPVNVLERCQPGGDGFYGCLLRNGAVLDLSQCNGELKARSPYVKGCDSTTYQPNSTITIHLAGRAVRGGQRFVAWDTPPENVTFVLDDESRAACRCRIRVAEDGIYVVRGFVVIIL